MPEIIMISSGKGGVGKSTFAAYLGKVKAREGKKVLLIDGDVGLGALDTLLKTEEKTVYSWVDAFRGGCSAEDAVTEAEDNLFLLSAPKIYEENLPENALKNVIESLKTEFDYTLIDCSAGIDENLKICVLAAEKGIFIATADEISVKCAAAAASRAEEFGMSRDCMRLVINRFEKKAALKAKLLNVDGVIDKSGVMLLGIVPEDKSVPYFSVTGAPPKDKSKFMKAVKRISKRVDGEYVGLEL